MFLHSLSSFLCKHCICGHKCDYSIVDMPSLRSARYICLAANSICFRYAQARYDIDPRSRSEHIECVSTYRTRQRISKIRASGSISMRSVLKGTTLMRQPFLFSGFPHRSCHHASGGTNTQRACIASIQPSAKRRDVDQNSAYHRNRPKDQQNTEGVPHGAIVAEEDGKTDACVDHQPRKHGATA